MKLSERQWSQLFELSKQIGKLNESYLLSYQIFLEFFNEKNVLSVQDVIVGANFSYGWMPTILNIYSNDIIQQVEILNRLKLENAIPTDEELLLLKKTFNNSIVGTSKLMHFISPEIIPIWDSRVHKSAKKILGINTQVNSIKNFKLYLEFCISAIANPRFTKLKNQIISKTSNKMTEMRTIEQLLFLTSEKL